jgi:hypothetical protein
MVSVTALHASCQKGNKNVCTISFSKAKSFACIVSRVSAHDSQPSHIFMLYSAANRSGGSFMNYSHFITKDCDNDN